MLFVFSSNQEILRNLLVLQKTHYNQYNQYIIYYHLKVSNILIGTGTGIFQTIGQSALQQQINNSFSAIAWDVAASQIATAVDAFIKAVIVQGTANGVVPINSWVGTGTGAIS